jgi:hypothetical protein
VIADRRAFWSVSEASILFMVSPRRARALISASGIEPAGRRPHGGRGRSELVWDADDLIDVLGG